MQGSRSDCCPDVSISGDREDVGGKYFGICPSFHHSKACNCKKCPSYPGDGYMFCSKKNLRPLPSKAGCLCDECYVHEQFALEGDFFCRGEGK